MSAALRAVPADAEWLQPDGSGGFASGTVGLIRTRRYHALLLTCMTPPTGRVVLVNGLEAWIERPGGSQPLSSQRYAPDVVHPDLAGRILEFSHEPWPRWVFGLADGKTVEQELLVDTACGDTILRWRTSAADGVLHVRPLLSGRDYHSLHRENSGFDFRATVCGGSVAWRPYADRPAIACLTNAAYRHDPAWFRQFLYTAERERGLDCIEDLASPGEFVWPAGTAEAVMVLRPGALCGAGDGGGAGAPGRLAGPAGLRRGRLSGGSRRRIQHRRRLPMVHRLGQGHVHRLARPAAGDRTNRPGRDGPAGMVRPGVGRDVAEPLRRRRRAGIQHRRCLAVVLRGGA
jgi:hypothetical protein